MRLKAKFVLKRARILGRKSLFKLINVTRAAQIELAGRVFETPALIHSEMLRLKKFLAKI